MNREPIGRRCVTGLLLASLALLPTVSAAQESEPPKRLIPLDGPPVAMSLARVSPDWELSFTSPEGPRRLGADQVVFWGSWREPDRGSIVLLRSGDLLVGYDLHLPGEQLAFDSDSLGQVSIPMDAVAGLIFQLPSEAARRDRLMSRVLAETDRQTRLLLTGGDTVSGSLAGIEPDGVMLQTEAGSLRLPLDRVTALVQPGGRDLHQRAKAVRALVGLEDGSRLTCKGLVVTEKEARLDTSLGQFAVAADRVCALQPTSEKIVYLSDLEAASYRQIPFLSIAWPYRRDRSVTQTLLRSGGALYLKGLGTHSAARLTYELDQTYRRLDMELALDESAGNRGSVIYRVFSDNGSGQWQERYSSPVVRGGASPIAASADLAGAKRISLLVEFADRGDELDHANWLNARLVR